MGTIRPHLWYDREAREAAEYYISTFPDSRIIGSTILRDTPSGDCDVVAFELFGQPFEAISAGPLFRFTPAISFSVACETEAEVDDYWKRLSDGGTALMPLDAYPFSPRYGWTTDRYGLSWQVGLYEGASPRITPTLMFTGEVCGKAEEAIGFYATVFPRASVDQVVRYEPGDEPDTAGTLRYTSFTLDGQTFAAMDSARAEGGFNEAISLMVECGSQEEIDRYWQALSAVPESEQCGWLKDRFGVSWQIVPAELDQMMFEASEEQLARVVETFLPMHKLEIEPLRRAYEGR